MKTIIDKTEINDIKTKKKRWLIVSIMLLVLVALILVLSFVFNNRDVGTYIIVFSSIAISILLIILLFINKFYLSYYGKFINFFSKSIDTDLCEIKEVKILKINEKYETFRGFLTKKVLYTDENNKENYLFIEQNFNVKLLENKSYKVKLFDSFLLAYEEKQNEQ